MGQSHPNRMLQIHLLLPAVLIAGALLVPAHGFAALDPMFRTFQTFPQGQYTPQGRLPEEADFVRA